MTRERMTDWRSFRLETVAALRKACRDLVTTITGRYSEHKGEEVKWYSGTWCIEGCPNCPCRIEYVSFVGAYDTKNDKWISFQTDDVCPLCGAHLINACLAPEPKKLVSEFRERPGETALPLQTGPADKKALS